MIRANIGVGESSTLKYRFTAYLVTAIQRKKCQYIRAATERSRRQEMFLEIDEFAEALSLEQDLTAELPVLEQLENMKLAQALLNAKERELRIFFLRVLEERPFSEIAASLGIGISAAVSIYYRLVARLAKEMGVGGDGV